jgi:dihydroflavonol-4-reductase
MPRYPNIGMNCVDVRDIAELHIRALGNKRAYGKRIIGSGEFLLFGEIAKELREGLGPKADKVPDKALPDFILKFSALWNADAKYAASLLGKRSTIESNLASELLEWRPRFVKETIIDTANSVLTAWAKK